MATRSKPAIIKVFSGIVRRDLPTRGLRINDEAAEIPMRKPISASAEPNLER
jgi:hypothetical protein